VNFLKKLGKIHAKSKRLRMKSVRDKTMKDTEFWVTHYAGDVKYDVVGFMNKSRDELFRNISEVLAHSKVALIGQTLWGPDVDYDGRSKSAAANTTSRNKRSSGSNKKPTLSGQFRKQLVSLMNTLNEATPHYIRCIKPNAVKQPKTFNAPMNLEQLTYSGIFEAVQIRKQGYPFRLTHQLFFCRYSHLISYLLRTNKSDRYRTAIANHPVAFEELAQLGAQGAQGAQGQHYKTNIVVLMHCLSILEPALMNQLELGLTMVLYRAPQHRWLEGTVDALLAGYLAPSTLLICFGFCLVSVWCPPFSSPVIGYNVSEMINEWGAYAGVLPQTADPQSR
jgi:hypothetical protein